MIFFLKTVFVLSVFLNYCTIALDFNIPGGLVASTYAKVAKWGLGQTPNSTKVQEEARSNNGQSFYTQRSDVNVRASNSNQVNKSPVYKPEIKKDKGFQDRFNPPPYFSLFGKDGKKLGQATQNDPKIVYPQNSYDSGITSYDPKPSGIPDILNSADPPTDDTKSLYDSNVSSYNPAPSGIPKDENPPSIQGPTFPPYDTSNQHNSEEDSPMRPNDYDDHSNHNLHNFDSLGEGDHKMKPEDDYLDLHHNHDHDHHHHHHNSDSSNGKPMFPPYLYTNFSSLKTKPVIVDENPYKHHHNSDYEEKSPDFVDDLPEYVEHDPHVGKFAYPYQFDDHHHPVTQPMPKPVTMMMATTTEMPEDERVNKGHYSYYYLGRKLWYIPLYFSVYFIIYITVLILKSIARHKVSFAHDITNLNKERSFSSGNEQIADQIFESTTEAINRFKRRYYAM